MAYSYTKNSKYQYQTSHSPPFYSQRQRNPAGSHLTSIQCSAVRENINSDHMLGGSQVSWLDNIEEQNERNYEALVSERKKDKLAEKQTNLMKFSFNAKDQHQFESDSRKPSDRFNQQQSLKEIYYQQFQKQVSKIKDVQQARKAMLDTLTKKQKGKKYNNNKQNLVGSIRRLNQEDRQKINTKSKFEQSNQNYVNNGQFERVTREEQQKSLKYLQQSLAKKDIVRVPLSKLTYLQQSQANKEPSASKVVSGGFNVRQFVQEEIQFDLYLGNLFEELDGKKLGKIYRQNCEYKQLNDELKIGFGQLFVQLIFKDLVLNKVEFIKMAKKILKDIDCLQFQRIVKGFYTEVSNGEANKLREAQKLQQTIKRRRSQKRSVDQQGKTFQLSSQLHHNNINEYVTEPKKQYNSVDAFRRKINSLKNNNLIQNQHQMSSRVNSQLPKFQLSTKIEAEKMLAKYSQNYNNLQKNQQICKQYLLSLHKSYPLADIPQSIQTKIRNISEEMIRQHKHNLQILIKLNNLMENCLSVSRRQISSFSSDKYSSNCQSTHQIEKNRKIEWPSFPY